VQFRHREGIAILAQITADGYLSAERVAAVGHVKRIKTIRIGLHQNGNLKAGEFDGINNRFLVAKIWEDHQDAVNGIRVFLEQIGADAGMLVGLHGAMDTDFFAQHNVSYAKGIQNFNNFFACLGYQVPGEEVSAAKNHAKGGFHIFSLNN
jgi:hypothetical protein